MENIVVPHFKEKDFRTYYLSFDASGDKSQELLDILMDSLLEFIFGINYMDTITPQMHNRFFNACEKLYKEKRDTKKEGDLGEIILHTILRKYFDSIPFTGRFYFAVDKNTNAKSFDIIHLLPSEEKNILILGESKMFTIAKKGIDALVNDIREHFQADYARKQFVRISELTHSDDQNIQNSVVIPMKKTIDYWEYQLRTKETLDEVVDELYVPLLCTYTYDEYKNHKEATEDFIEKYQKEMEELLTYFQNKKYTCPSCLSIVLILFPVPCKDTLIHEYYKRIDAEVGK